MIINKIWKTIMSALCPAEPQSLELVEEYVCFQRPEGRGSKVTELPKGEPLGEMSDLDYFTQKVEKSFISPAFLEEEKKEAERIAKAEALQLQKTIIEWQRLAGVTPEKTLDLLIPIKEGRTERRRSVNFNSTPEMVAYLADKGFVPYDMDYIEEARTGKYRFIRIKKPDVKNFFEFPDATFNGPEFSTPYKADYSHPIVYGPYLAPHQLSNPVPVSIPDIEATDGKISTLSPLSRNRHLWECTDGIYSERPLPEPFVPERKYNSLKDWEELKDELVQKFKPKEKE
jgi:hypothetical protein